MGKVSELNLWGATLTNDRWGWDGAKADGSILFIGWEDNTVRSSTGELESCTILHGNIPAAGNLGRLERVRHIEEILRDESAAYLLVARAKNTQASPRQILSIDPVQYSVRLVQHAGNVVAYPVGYTSTRDPVPVGAGEPLGDYPDLSPDLPETERKELIRARVGQGLFRRRLELIEPCCRITGTSDRVHLRASHIKPWHASTNRERLDGHNGLLLAPHADHIFDRGFISFGPEGELLISPHLKRELLNKWSIESSIARKPFSLAQCVYLEYHRDVIFRA